MENQTVHFNAMPQSLFSNIGTPEASKLFQIPGKCVFKTTPERALFEYYILAWVDCLLWLVG